MARVMSVGGLVARNDSADCGAPVAFGRYSVVREIGRGGMARVYEGRHCELNKRVAIKVLLRPGEKSAAARFLHEGKTAAQIRHPNVVDVIDAGTEGDVPYLVMEFLEGVVLTQRLRDVGALTTEEAVDTTIPVISAIAAAHSLGIIHRDLKPGNIMLRRCWRGVIAPTVLDFGISKHLREDDAPTGASESGLTDSRAVLGTLPYLAPETTSGARFASTLSDQYSLGVMLYECITGARPFAAQGVYEMMHAIVTAPIAPPSERVAGIPPGLEEAILRTLERSPKDRYPSMHALGAELLAFASPRVREQWDGEFSGLASSRIVLLPSRPEPVRSLPLLNEGTTRSVGTRPPEARHWFGLVAGIGLAGALAASVVLTRGGRGGMPRSGATARAAADPSEVPVRAAVEPRAGDEQALAPRAEGPVSAAAPPPTARTKALVARPKASAVSKVAPLEPLRGTREVPIFD
jgi:serine/threonine protein kinase